MSISNTIEAVGRGITSYVAGEPTDTSAQRARGNALLKNMGTGGLMLGGGAAALVAAYNLIDSLNKEKEMDDEERLDDDSLYISDPHKVREKSKSAAEGVSPILAPGLAVTAAIAGTGAGYALVQKIWNKAEKSRRLALLDVAQRDAISAADLEVEKMAADPKFNVADALTAGPVALPLLAMLASGGLTYAALSKSFPITGKPKRHGPKRIRVASQPYKIPEEDSEEEELEQTTKQSSVTDLRDAGDEFLASIVASASPRSITNDFISKAASGGLTEMEHLLTDGGSAAVIAAIKGASRQNSSQERRMLGTMALFKSAALQDTVRSVVVAEYLEQFGNTFTAISGCSRTMRKMASIGCLLGVIARDHALPDLAKQAVAMGGPPTSPQLPELLERLRELLQQGGNQPQADGGASKSTTPGGSHQQKEDRDAALTSDAGGGVGGFSEDGEASKNESTGNNDMIDDVLDPETPNLGFEPSV